MILYEPTETFVPDPSDAYNDIMQQYLNNAMFPNQSKFVNSNGNGKDLGYSRAMPNTDHERNIVNKYAKQYDVDPYIVLAMMDAETGGGIKDSHKGAKGRLQLMPGTAAAEAKELGMTNYDINDLETNLHLGIRYYRKMLDKYQDPWLAVAAYNAGPGNMSKVNNDYTRIKETRNHVPKVRRFYNHRMEVDKAIETKGLKYYVISGKSHLFHPKIGEALVRANDAMMKETGKALKITSAFRTNTQQQEIYARSKKEGFRAAKPGRSNHEQGMAVDISNWKEAAPFLYKEKLLNPLADDKVHFSFTGR